MYQAVQDYYGKALNNSGDLKTNACCTEGAPPEFIRKALNRVHDEVKNRYYGCGLVAPQLLDGCSILDLGSGSGLDCYVLSQLVGERGHIVGVDMTDEQLAIANRHLDYHAQLFSYKKSNVEFRKGYIEKLNELDLDDQSFDVIVSNCVINLSPDKLAVLNQAWRLLKPGGELYFSDVYADRRVDESLKNDPELYGECLSGALYWNDFLNLAKQAGFADPRLVEDRPLTIENESIQKRLGATRFYSATYRLFKLDQLEPACEDYGQAVIYRGGIEHHRDSFMLDKHHIIETKKVFPVCGNSWRMLHDTRFKSHFEFIGSRDKHFGIFDGCGDTTPFNSDTANADESSCC